MDEFWRLIHLVAAAFWLGGLIFLAVAVLVAFRVLPRESARTFVRAAARAFLIGSVVAGVAIVISGAGMAADRVKTVADLQETTWGRTLELKTGLVVIVVLATAAHVLTGRMSSRPALMASRVLAVAVMLGTLGIFYFGVRLTEG